MALPDDLLQRSAEEAARQIALSLLGTAQAAAGRLDDETDLEALHDFRVSVRRLRSALRAYAPQLVGAVKKRDRRRLRRVQDATGRARDAEVALAWLDSQRETLAPQQLAALDALATRLRRRRERILASTREDVRREFARVGDRLQRQLARLTVETNLLEPGIDAGEAFAPVFSARARRDARALTRQVASVSTSDDQRGCHRARIACKRLRYLVEPLRGGVPEAKDVVRRCKRLQDDLGELNDAHLLRAELERTLAAARALRSPKPTAPPAPFGPELLTDLEPGLVELARRVDARIERRFAQIDAEWLGGGAASLTHEVDRMARRLARRAPSGYEIERKYLLRRLPDLPPEAELIEIDQGWIPGERLRERVRRQRTEAGAAYFRTLKFGSGVKRVEIEESTSAAVFATLWSLTKDCRIQKIRHRVREADHVWEIDEFLDRELFLAEVELTSAAEQPVLPSWLAEVVVRDVTEDARYTNFELARGGERAPCED
jgi:CHAD domain-containing protein/CYTH domain-containing protein